MAWKIVLALVAVLLVFYCAVVIWIPSYRFDDPTPFEGRFIYNPYNSASHVYEVEPQIKSLEETFLFSLVPSIHSKQHRIFDEVKKDKNFVLTDLHRCYKTRDFQALDGYSLMNVFSSQGDAVDCWDMALSSGRRACVVAYGDDAKMKRSMFVFLDKEDEDKAFEAMKTGNAYALVRPNVVDDIPYLLGVDLRDDTIEVRLSRQAEEICFIGQNGVICQRDSCVSATRYIFRPSDSYIRTEVRFADGSTMYLNAIVRHQYALFFDQLRVAEIGGRTWLMRIAFIIAIFCLIKIFFFSKNED